MRTVGRRSFLMVVCVVLTLAFVLSSCQPTAVPVPEAETVSAGPLAQVTFVVTPPAGTDSSAKLTLEILDEVTGLALNPSRLSMTATSDGRFTVEAAFSEGSLVKYRYLREGTPPAVEYGSTNQQIRYRIFRVYGSDQVEDIIAAWNDQPFTGAVGRIRGQAIDNTNNTPLPNLYVTAAGISTLTSSDGSFLLEGIPVGTHQLVAISLDGAYKTFQQGATVAAGATTPAAIALSPVQMIAVNFVVKPPEGNLTGVPIRMVGNLFTLGNTFADLSGGMSVIASRAPLLTLRDDGTYAISLSLPVGFDLRYKYTLGDGFWNGELNASGNFRTRQLIVPAASTTVEDQIDTWQTGTAAPITFTVTIPDNTPATDSTSIQFNPFGWMEPIPMWPLGNHRYTYILYNPLSMLGDVGYRYCRNEQCGVADAEGTQGPSSAGYTFTPSPITQTFEDTVSSWQWWQPASTPTTVIAPEIRARDTFFWAGVEFQPGYKPSWQSHYSASFQTLKGIGSNWVVIPMTWTFTRDAMPVLQADPGNDALWPDLVQQVALARQSGLKVALVPSVRYEIASQDWWSNASKDLSWWDGFFDQYGTYLRNAADFASVNDVGAILVGDAAILPAYPGMGLVDGSPANQPDDIQDRWDNMISDVRTRYSGQLLYQVEFTGSNPAAALPASLFDGIYMIWNAPLTTSDEPAAADLEVEMGRLLDEEIAPFQVEAGKPVILALQFASAAGSARQCVSLSGNCLPGIALSQPYLELQSIPVNLQAQVDLYNAALGAINGRDWISGVISRGYYPPAALQDGSFSIHGKPAMDVLWYWFPRMTGAITP